MTIKHSINTLALLTAGLACVPASAGVINGGFEDPLTPPGGYSIWPSIPGWTGGANGIEVQNHAAGSPYAGNNLAELDSNGNSSMSQVVATIPGQAYGLSFAYSPRPGVPADSNPVEAWFNGTLLGTFTGDGIGLNDTVWTLHDFTVMGTGSDTIQFVATGISDSLGGYLDEVQLTTVPEPATLLPLLGATLAGVWWYRRGRKN